MSITDPSPLAQIIRSRPLAADYLLREAFVEHDVVLIGESHVGAIFGLNYAFHMEGEFTEIGTSEDTCVRRFFGDIASDVYSRSLGLKVIAIEADDDLLVDQGKPSFEQFLRDMTSDQRRAVTHKKAFWYYSIIEDPVSLELKSVMEKFAYSFDDQQIAIVGVDALRIESAALSSHGHPDAVAYYALQARRQEAMADKLKGLLSGRLPGHTIPSSRDPAVSKTESEIARGGKVLSLLGALHMNKASGGAEQVITEITSFAALISAGSDAIPAARVYSVRAMWEGSVSENWTDMSCERVAGRPTTPGEYNPNGPSVPSAHEITLGRIYDLFRSVLPDSNVAVRVDDACDQMNSYPDFPFSAAWDAVICFRDLNNWNPFSPSTVIANYRSLIPLRVSGAFPVRCRAGDLVSIFGYHTSPVNYPSPETRVCVTLTSVRTPSIWFLVWLSLSSASGGDLVRFPVPLIANLGVYNLSVSVFAGGTLRPSSSDPSGFIYRNDSLGPGTDTTLISARSSIASALEVVAEIEGIG